MKIDQMHRYRPWRSIIFQISRKGFYLGLEAHIKRLRRKTCLLRLDDMANNFPSPIIKTLPIGFLYKLRSGLGREELKYKVEGEWW
jgi:hypothetical protein